MSDHSRLSVRSMTRIKHMLIAGYAVITVLSILIVSLLAIGKTDDVLKNKVSTLVSALGVQMKLNLNGYLQRMETLGTLAFAAEESYIYDATNPVGDEYDALTTEKIISDKLYSLCIMENFVDYGIVYRNNHIVGKISNGTLDLFGEALFDKMYSMITQQRTSDGLCAGPEGNYKRIYYVKEIHENAVLVISFYTSELEDVFDNPETMGDMTIRLTDSAYHILYSSADDAPGSPLPQELAERIAGQDAATVLDHEQLVTVSSCADDWYVICSIPTRIILNEKNEIRLYIILTAFVAALLAVMLGAWLSIRLTGLVTNLVTKLDSQAHIDQLTGILNKRTFEDRTAGRLSGALSIERHALILLDVDDFKGVNDTLGHAYGDAVLAKIGSTLLQTFSADDYLGRIGGDEFCIFMNIRPDESVRPVDLVRMKCEALSAAFHDFYTGDQGDYKISCSMGIAFFPRSGQTFPELYAAADKALYRSKQRGKDTYSICDDPEEKEVHVQ